jgi:hypothetical protein
MLGQDDPGSECNMLSIERTTLKDMTPSSMMVVHSMPGTPSRKIIR